MTILSKLCAALVFGQVALAAPEEYYSKSDASTTQRTYAPPTTTHRTYPPETTTQYTYPPETTTQYTYPPETTTQRTYPPETTTQRTYPPQTTTERTYPPETTSQRTYPPHTTERTYLTKTTTQRTYPPHTTTERTYPPHTTTKRTYPPETTTERTYPPHTTERTYLTKTTTQRTYPPHTTTYPPHTTTERTYPPQTTTERTYPPQTSTHRTYPPQTTTNPPQTYPPMGPHCPQMDGKTEVMLPPLLDEDNTQVVFSYGNEDMQVRLLIPKQYSTLKVDFEGADSEGAALDVDLSHPSANFWDFDFSSDPCNVIVTSSIPWNEFRRKLGGVSERRYPNSVWYGTQINIETTFDFELKPETLLLLLAEDDNPHHIQRHTRVVRNVIPFDIHFDLDLNLWSQIVVRSPYLRKATALLESSVLSVSPDSDTMAQAELEFVTIIPSPLILSSADIQVDDAALAHGLAIEEIAGKRDCYDVNEEAFCTQHWRVHVAPKKCDLNGQYTATMYGACNPQSNNCVDPNPNTMDIVFDITSDDYCGVSQQVDLRGHLNLRPTRCNEYMKGSIVTSSPQGAKISRVEILELIAAPTLEGQEFLTIYDADNYNNGILSFSTSHPAGNQVDFQFEWRGKQLRCDVVAQVDAMVRVEFEATEPLLLSASSNGRHSRTALLDDEDMRMTERVMIAADPNAESEEAGVEDAAAVAAAESGAVAVAATSSIAAVGVASVLSAFM